ncbi:hypothetical protein PVIIG_01831 [Plasmodium vivax India VII]|uniref:VIR protein n=2 Tax=Plasmodium vivax TaxID=5855 RepID=A0A1G4GSL2_PLAVI|nr:hypothetical protein PVIIG_01831 [Plasmodium vivax India VII]SCO65512.1 hypothetical protein PVT01_030032700 [Plasmodium vivax]
MGSYKNKSYRHRLDIDSEPPRRSIHGGNAPQGEKKYVDFRELLEDKGTTKGIVCYNDNDRFFSTLLDPLDWFDFLGA